jgi:hypothetical protein
VLSCGKSILDQIAQASRTLELVTPYVRGGVVEDALLRSAARRKRLLTRYSPADILSGKTDLALLGRLRRSVEVRLVDDVQARAYIVDGSWGYVGSCALTPPSFCDSGADLGVAVTDDASLRALEAQFERLWSCAAELTCAQWTLAQHASDGAMEMVADVRRDLLEAERALGRFVEIPRLHGGRRRTSAAPARQTPDFVRRRMLEWAGTAPIARALADFLAWTLETIPGADASAAWTVLLGEHHVRVKLGLPEILSVEEAEEGGGIISVMGLGARLDESARTLLRACDARVVPSPYASATGLTRDALRISFAPRDLPRLRAGLEPGLRAYLELHSSHAATVAQRCFASSVLEYLEDELDRAMPWPRDRARPSSSPVPLPSPSAFSLKPRG